MKNRVWALTVHHEVIDDVLVLTIRGRAGTEGSRQLADALTHALRNGRSRMLCDIAGLDYASSAGLLALDAAALRIREGGGELLVCGMTEPVRVALDLYGIAVNFSVADSRAAALARLGMP